MSFDRQFGNRLADSFHINPGDHVRIERIRLMAYEIGALPPNLSTISGVYVQFWNGDPRDPNSQVIWGHQQVNLLDPNLSGPAEGFRVREANPRDFGRSLQAIVISLGDPSPHPNLELGAGTYWIDVTAQGSLPSGPFMPMRSERDNIPVGGAIAFHGGAWHPIVDPTWNTAKYPGGQPVGLPFILEGSIISDCYPNCDGSTGTPILTVDDFTCFINEFAAASTLPAGQQIHHYANCDGNTTPPILTVDDFTCFINAFAAGCP